MDYISKKYFKLHLISTRPELQLIVSCAKVEIQKEQVNKIQSLLQQNIDWEYFLITANLHKVLPLVYVNLVNLFSEYVPNNILNQLQKFVQTKTQRNLYLVRELFTLTNIFESNGISAIPYKGIVLSAAVYGDLALRQFVDLDFLVPTKEYLKAQELLMSEGYKPPPQNNVNWERSFVHAKKQIGVDLHQGLTPDYLPVYIDFEGLWQRLEPVLIGGIEFKTFAPEDLLIVLCIQLAKDAQWTAEVLIKVCDIAELIRVYQNLNWDLVWERCVKLGTKSILLFSLFVVKELLETSLPDSILQKMAADNIAKKAAQQVCEEFFMRSEQSFREKTYKERTFLRKLARERWQDKVRYFVKTALTPNELDFAFLSLPQQLSLLYYFLRPIRLMAKLFSNGLKK
ncbi:MAG: nucleotidyltransferase family protein [Xenococcaceae cyanobacterium MO_188.B19]|nr:nucleotidyltransferase family protein [Xenococcaceae cyanobacterium MO_188.B19]